MTAAHPPVGDRLDGAALGTESSPLVPALRAAVRKGATAAPVGVIAGAALGFVGSGSEEFSTSETALVMAVIFGFILAPTIASAITISRAIGRTRRPTLSRIGVGGLGAIVTSGLWAVIGAVVMIAATYFTGIQLNAVGLLITGLLLAMLSGLSASVITALAVRGGRPCESV